MVLIFCDKNALKERSPTITIVNKWGLLPIPDAT
jgi:hypothetical protein